MKKILAVLIAVIMMFSLTAVSASAAAPGLDEAQATVDGIADVINGAKDDIQSVVDGATDIYGDIKDGDYSTILDDVYALIENYFSALHSIVHALSEMFDFVCPLCTGEEETDAPVVVF